MEFLHQLIVLYSFQDELKLCKIVCNVSVCLLVIGINQLLEYLCRFRCCHLQSLYDGVLFLHIVFSLCGNHKCICDGPVNGLKKVICYTVFKEVFFGRGIEQFN